MSEQYLLDTSVLVSAINSADDNHLQCHSFIEDHPEAVWIVPTLAFFEFQATQSRLRRDGSSAIREVYLGNHQPYEITLELTRRANELDLFNKFDRLTGADLVFACIAAVESVPLVSADKRFLTVKEHIEVIYLQVPTP